MVIDCDSFLVIFIGWRVIVIVSWASENNLIYLRCYSGWVCDCDSFLIISIVENNLVYLRSILLWLTIMIVSWAIENKLVNLRG